MTRVHYVMEGICTKDVSGEILKVAVLPLVLGYISFCSKRGPINSKRWPKASTGRRNFSRNSLGFLDLKQPSFLKLPRSTDYLTSQEVVEFLSKTTCFYTTICFSEVLLSVFTSDKRLVFCTCDLQVGLL